MIPDGMHDCCLLFLMGGYVSSAARTEFGEDGMEGYLRS
jgi:hypothetical protein